MKRRCEVPGCKQDATRVHKADIWIVDREIEDLESEVRRER